MKRRILFLFWALAAAPAVSAGVADTLTLSLAECRRRALASSEAVGQAALRERQADFDRQIARAAYLPALDATALGAYMLPDMDMMGMKLRMHGTYVAGLSLTQPLYAGGRIQAGERLARTGRQVAAEQSRLSRHDVLQDVDQAYYTYVATRGKVRVVERHLALADTLCRQVRTACAAGMATESDWLRAQAGRSRVRYQLQKAEHGALLCRLALCRAIGAGPEVQIIPTDTVFADAWADAPAEQTTPAARPELRLLELRVDVARHQERMARADMLPSVGLQAGYVWFGGIDMKGTAAGTAGEPVPFKQEIRDGNFVAMLAVKVPLFSWGANRSKIRKARLDTELAGLELQKNRRLMQLELQQARLGVADAAALIRTARLALSQATENLRVLQNRYNAAMAPLSDLLQAQADWQTAEGDLIEAQAQYKINQTAYLRAAGRLE